MSRLCSIALVLFLVVPVFTEAQQAGRVARVGELVADPLLRQTCRQGLRELGYFEGRNITFETRVVEGPLGRLSELAAELVRLRVDLIFVDTSPALQAVGQATKTIPIVMAGFGDPVAEGFVTTLARPGGNITGFSWQTPESAGKRLELLREVLSTLSRVAVLFDPKDPVATVELKAIRAAARELNVATETFGVGEPYGTISHRLRTISQAFERAGIRAPMTTTIRVDIWDKLLRNLSTSPICALTGEPIAVLGRHPEFWALAKGLMREGLAVCSAYGIHIDLDPERAYGTRPISTHKSSMLQDFERHRPPEIDGLLTAVQEFARAARIATPQLDAITALVIEKARRMGLYPLHG